MRKLALSALLLLATTVSALMPASVAAGPGAACIVPWHPTCIDQCVYEYCVLYRMCPGFAQQTCGSLFVNGGNNDAYYTCYEIAQAGCEAGVQSQEDFCIDTCF